MASTKIEKLNADIARMKEKIAAFTVKLRDYEKQRTVLEKEEIYAFFNREKLNEDELAALLRETGGIPEKYDIKKEKNNSNEK
jgi:hypothetical protein